MLMLNQLFAIFSVKSQIEYSRKKLYQAAYSWCHDRALAEDLVQETLVKALSSSARLQHRKYLDTWLYRILVNTWHDYLKRKKESLPLDEYTFTSNSDLEKDYLSGELVTQVRQEVAKLPMALREVITLSDYSGFSYQQIAEIVDIPVGTVMSRLFRARKLLERSLIEVDQSQQKSTHLRQVK